VGATVARLMALAQGPSSRETWRGLGTDTPVRLERGERPDSLYGGDLDRADMAWALHAAARGLSQEQIEHEILNIRDLSKRTPHLLSSVSRDFLRG
jgi:hypothetical protein